MQVPQTSADVQRVLEKVDAKKAHFLEMRAQGKQPEPKPREQPSSSGAAPSTPAPQGRKANGHVRHMTEEEWPSMTGSTASSAPKEGRRATQEEPESGIAQSSELEEGEIPACPQPAKAAPQGADAPSGDATAVATASAADAKPAAPKAAEGGQQLPAKRQQNLSATINVVDSGRVTLVLKAL